MNILFTTQLSEMAGSAYSLSYLAKGLSNRGHQIHVACPRSSFIEKLLLNSNVTIHHVSFSHYFHIKSVLRVKKIISNYKIQIINPQLGKDRNITMLAVGLFKAKAIAVFTRRQVPRDEPWLKRYLHCSVMRGMIVISNELKKIFIKTGYPESLITVIENGIPNNEFKIDAEQINTLKEKYGLNDVVIGCVARLKKQVHLIQALKHLPGHYTCLFVGIRKDELKQVMKDEKPSQRLIFTGELSHEAAKFHYQLMDVNILPSTMDGFGLVLVESMQAGIPVIGTNYGGIKNVIENGITGLLYEKDSPDDLAIRIKQIIEDDTLRKKIVSQAKKQVSQRFNLNIMLDKYESHFKKITTGD